MLLADTTIYELEQRGEFPRRFNLTARCLVWYLGEVQDWLVARRKVALARRIGEGPVAGVHILEPARTPDARPGRDSRAVGETFKSK